MGAQTRRQAVQTACGHPIKERFEKSSLRQGFTDKEGLLAPGDDLRDDWIMVDAETSPIAEDGIKEFLREQIAAQYLDSSDFNGVGASQLIDAVKKLPVDASAMLTELVADGAIYANFGHEMVNPHILGFPHQSAADNLAEVQRRGEIRSAVLYPTRDTLNWLFGHSVGVRLAG